MAPRLAVGAVFGPTPLALEFERAGHIVRPVDAEADPGAIAQVDLVLLDAPADQVRLAAGLLASHARPRQMFLHTVLEEGPQLLDDVETAQAIVMCAHNVFADVWVTSAADELGETVVGLLVAEVGGVSMRIDDTSRPVIAAAQELRALESVVRGDAFELLVQAVPDMEAVAAQFRDAPAGASRAATPAQLDVLADALPEPGVRRLLVDLERRRGQQLGDTDTELWAMQKYEGG